MSEESAAAFRRWERVLIVGLGNPGSRYALSPHNLGFMAVDRLAQHYGIAFDRRAAHSLVGAGRLGPAAVTLAKPQTYMNLSGQAVRALLEREGLEPADLIVIYDDHDLPWRSLRIRERGSAGGHHGMESVICALGTEEFVRVRLGIQPAEGGRADPEFLLSPLGERQREELAGFLDHAVQAVAAIISEGVAKAMTRFNRRAPGQNHEEG